MAKMTVEGLENFSAFLQSIQDRGEGVMKAAVYAGAGAMVEAIKAEIQALPEEEGYLPDGEKRHVVTKNEKEALLSHIGIAKMEFTGGKVSTAIGFDGYTNQQTKKYPAGVPVPMIARAIESGSSVRMKIPFMRRAAAGAKERVQAAMIEAAEKEIQKIK